MKKIYIIGLVIILIGGVFMAFSLNGNREKHKEEFRERQDRIALYFVNNYELSNGEEIKKIKVLSLTKHHMTGIWGCELLINDKFNISLALENYEIVKIGSATYQGEEIKRIKPPKNSTKLEVKIEYLED